MSFGGVFLLCLAASSARAITNSQDFNQYQQYQNQYNQGALSPQEQTHILSDVQQHRFLVQPERHRPQQTFRPPPPPPPPPQQQPSFPPFQQYQQDFQFPNYQPQFQPERKPVLLTPTYPQEQKQTFTPPTFQSFNHQEFQPSYQQPEQNFQYQQPFQNFENNYVVTDKPKHHQFLTEVTQPKAPVVQETYTPKPQQEETPAWILETQPPTPYRKQKPLEAITFATFPTETYQTTTVAPRVVKYRPRPKTEDKFPNKEETGEIYIKPDRKKLYEQLIGSRKPPVIKSTTAKPARSTTTPQPIPDEKYIQEQLQKQIQEQLAGKDDIFKTLKITLPGDLSSDQIANLPNLALGDSVDQVPQVALPNLYLANGQKVKVSPPGKPNKKIVKTVVVQQTTAKPPEVNFNELTKGVLPPGADYEIIRQNQDGALENIGPLNNLQQKKVTFVILEEQPDGSVKVQGVRGNENGPTETKGAEVDSIIERLKKGEIKLPPSTKLSKPVPNSTPQESQASPKYVKHVDKTTVAPKRKTTSRPVYQHSTIANSHAGPIIPMEEYKRSTTVTPRKPQYSSPNRLPAFLPTLSSHSETSSSTPPPTVYTSSPPVYTTVSPVPSYSTPYPSQVSSQVYTSQTYPNDYSSQFPSQNNYQEFTTTHANTGLNAIEVLGDTLKKNGLYAMAKFLKQSGLDTVLNETGPYTLFVPTDKAFRSLLVQLGGPDRAEIKFKENPRLLSGLLLHHVIPGAFKVDNLLDEMTGVSLAGTQLRVNTYTTQDNEWNDIKVVTINGAKVNREKSDIVIPQGIAHAVDRVMFPLPVGDLVQTLQADREGRFSKFIRLLQETGVSSMLQGGKTYTVFAPTDSAFTEGELEKLLEQRGAARALALRHVTPGTLYSAGMLYYQLRDSMSSSNQIQLSKDAGRVKVNNAHVISRNIPATNGVIHAIDSLL